MNSGTARDALPPNPYNALAWLVGEPVIGEGTWIGAFCVIDGSGGLTVGRHCDIASGAQIYTHSTVARAVSKRLAPIHRRSTVVGDHCHIGAGAILLMGTRIGSHCVVGAGSVVLEGTVAADYSLIVGNPARILPGRARELLDRGSWPG